MFTCKICDYKSNKKEYLSKHEVSNVKFVCKVCDNEFRYKVSLKAHEKSVHEVEICYSMTNVTRKKIKENMKNQFTEEIIDRDRDASMCVLRKCFIITLTTWKT